MAGSDNPYLGVLRPEESPSIDNPYTDLLRTQTEAETDTVRQNLVNAQKTNPDTVAKATAIAGRTGMPADVVERNLDRIEPLQIAADATELTVNSPATKSFLADPTNAKIAVDDVENMTEFERIMNDIMGTRLTSFKSGADAALGDNAGGLEDVGRSLASGVNRINQGAWSLNRAALELMGLDGAAAFSQRMSDTSAFVSQEISPDVSQKAPIVQDILSGVESAGTSLASMATLNPAAALAIMGGTTTGLEYGAARDAGLEPGMSALYALQQGAVEVLTEKIPVEGLFKGIKAGTPMFKLLATQLLSENLTEQVATAWQDYNQWAFLQPDKTFNDYLAERPDAALSTLVATTTATILQTGITRAASAPFQREAQRATEAAEFVGGMDEAQKAAMASLMTLRDPARAAQFQASAMGQAGIDKVFIDAAALVDAVGNAEDSDAVYERMGFTSQEVVEAALTGNRLAISNDGFAANILQDDKMYAALRDHMTPDPDGATNAEAMIWEQSGLMDEIQRMGLDQPEAPPATPGQFFAVNPDTGAQVWYNPAPSEEVRAGSIKLNQVYIDKDGVFHTVTSAGDGTNRVIVSQGFNAEDPTNISVSEASAPISRKDAAEALNLAGATRLERAAEPAPGDPIEVAVDTAVTLAENEMGYQALFRSAQEAGMTPAQYQAYLTRIADTKDRARKAEAKKAMRQELAKATTERKALREKVRGEVAGRIAETPVYSAINQSRQDKLDRDGILDAIAGTVDVQAEIAALEQELPARQEAVAAAEASAAQITAQSKDAAAQLAAIEKEVGSWEKLAAKSSKTLDRARTLVDKLQTQYTAAVNASNTAIAEADRATGRNIGKGLQQAEAKAAKADQLAIDLQQAQAALETSLAASKDDQNYLADAREQAKALRAVNKEIDGQLKAANKGVDTARAKLKETTDSIQAIRKDAREAARIKMEKLGLPKDIIAAKGGVNPEIVAQANGFTDAFEMVIAMSTAAPFDTVVDQETDAQMARDHGDVLETENSLRSAIHALHNDSQAEAIAIEYNQMREQAGLGRVSAKLIRRSSQEMLKRYRVKNITPAQFLAAERKWGREAAKLLRAGDRAGAANAKFKQLMNFEMFRMASDIRAEIAKDIKHFRKYGNDRTKFPNMDAGFVDAIKTILVNYSLRPPMTDRAKQTLLAQAQAKAQDSYGSTLAIPKRILHEENSTNYQDLSYGDFSEVMETVKGLEQQGRDAKKIRVNGREMEVAEAKQRMLDKSADIAVIERAKNQQTRVSSNTLLEGTSYASWDDFNSSLDGIREFLAGMDVLVLKPEFILQMLDNGEVAGPWHQALMQPFVDAHDSKAKLTRSLTAPIIKKLQELPKVTGEKLSKRINVPELGMKLRRSEVLMIALNTGNESNLTKMVESRPGWTFEGVDAAVANLTVAEWEWVQSVWDAYETMYPFVEQIARDEIGRSPEKIESREFTTTSGVKMKGGYIPMLYDYNAILSDIKSKGKDGGELFNTQLRATVYNGMTKERTDYSAPVLLDIGSLPNAIGQVTHYITHYQAVKDARKLLNDPDIIKEVQSKLGPEYYDELSSWTDALANNNAAPPQDRRSMRTFNAILNELRTNYTVATLGLSWTTGVSQLLGQLNTIESLGRRDDGSFDHAAGAKWWGVGVAKMFSVSAVNQAFDLSKELKYRVDNVDQAIAEARRDVAGKPVKYRQIQHAALGVIGRIQLHTVDVPTWIGAFNKGLDQGKSEIDSAAYADSIVRTSQASGQLKDLSAIQRTHNGLLKTATMFMTYFTLLYNLQRRTGRDLTRAPGANLVGGVTRFMLLLALPAIASAFIGGEPPEDEDELLAWTGTHVVSYGLATFPLFGQAASSWLQGYDPKVTVLEGLPYQVANALDGTSELLWGDGDAEDAANVIGGFGRLFGLPGSTQAVDILKAVDQDGDFYDYFIGPKD